jgi:hypothetical protein
MKATLKAQVIDWRASCMPFTTAAERVLRAEGLDFRKLCPRSIRLVNAVARLYDDSNLWPICGAYSATERAIGRVRRQGCCDSALEYAYALEGEISAIVNS